MVIYLRLPNIESVVNLWNLICLRRYDEMTEVTRLNKISRPRADHLGTASYKNC